MVELTAWYALVKSAHFINYFIVIVILLGAGLSIWWKAINELTGIDDERLLHISTLQERRQKAANESAFARWRISLTELLLELKQDRTWGQGAEGEALIVQAILKSLSYVKQITHPIEMTDSIRTVLEKMKQSPAFVEVDGELAHKIANRNQLAFAFSISHEEGQHAMAAIVIPGEIYPGTPLGKENPMVLTFGKDTTMELQAAVAFGEKNKPVYMALKNLE